MWQKESAVVSTFYIIFRYPKITNLRKQQAPKAATSVSNEGRIQKKMTRKKHSWKKDMNAAGVKGQERTTATESPSQLSREDRTQ